jgi:hypothetical protein
MTQHSQNYKPSGVYITEEERRALHEARANSGMWDSAGNAFSDPAAETSRLQAKYGVDREAGLDPSTGQFWVPSDRPYITWFADSPDVGPGCLCSLCLKPILDAPVLRFWDNEHNSPEEARFHPSCYAEAERARPNDRPRLTRGER